jgi:hypothetical protein
MERWLHIQYSQGRVEKTGSAEYYTEVVDVICPKSMSVSFAQAVCHQEED